MRLETKLKPSLISIERVLGQIDGTINLSMRPILDEASINSSEVLTNWVSGQSSS
jgi:hypothetical protein